MKRDLVPESELYSAGMTLDISCGAVCRKIQCLDQGFRCGDALYPTLRALASEIFPDAVCAVSHEGAQLLLLVTRTSVPAACALGTPAACAQQN